MPQDGQRRCGDECIPFILWAYRGAVHSSTGFSPHERKMRTALVDCWMDREQDMGTSILDKLKNKIDTVRELATEHETRAKQNQKHYSRKET